MKKIYYLCAVSCAIIAAASCNKIEDKEGGYGILNVGMNLPADTKAAFSSEELQSTALVKIYKANHKGLVRSYTYSAMPSPFYLASDQYRVDIEAGEAAKASPATASWEQKSYKGSKEFTITAGNVTKVEVEACVNNAVSMISFDQTIADNFAEGYTFTIGLDADDTSTQLIYDASKSGAEGYFIISDIKDPSFKWTFDGILSKDGSTFAKNGEIKDLLPGKVYKMSLKYSIKDGDLGLTLLVDYTTDIVDDTIIFEPVSTGLSTSSVYEIWATRATVHADVDEKEYEGASIQFAYSADDVQWKYIDAVNDSEGTWKAVITGLTPSTEYTYKLVIDGEDVGDALTFTTEAAPQLPNSSFEYVSKVSGRDFYKFYDPNCGVAGATTKFWASGNGDEETGGSIIPGSVAVITVPDESDKVDGNRSVCAQSKSAYVTIAAGNLLTGQFVQTVGTSGGIVNFGRPWTSRPTALKIWCKYTTGKMDYVSGDLPAGTNLTKNQDYDRAQIKVALGTWTAREYKGTADSPVKINTTDPSTFVDFYTDKSTIANGDIIIYHDGHQINRGSKETGGTDEWVQYTIPIEYRDLETNPTHIIISCAASQYGDYFTGSTSSRLWLDRFELLYE